MQSRYDRDEFRVSPLVTSYSPAHRQPLRVQLRESLDSPLALWSGAGAEHKRHRQVKSEWLNAH